MAAKGGKRPGAGRKPKRDEDDQRALIARALPIKKQEALVNRMYEIAMGDNLKAAVTAGSLLLAYSLGKPVDKVHHLGDGGGPIEVVVRHVSATPKD